MEKKSMREKYTKRATFWRLSLGSSPKVTKEQVEYFHKNPDEIDEVTAPLNIHLMYLLVGVIIGVSFIAIAKALSFSGILSSLSPMMVEFIVDLTFEIGNAFVGAGATALVLGVLLNAQQKNADAWKTEIRRLIRDRYG